MMDLVDGNVNQHLYHREIYLYVNRVLLKLRNSESSKHQQCPNPSLHN